MTVEDFCIALAPLKLSPVQNGLALLWFYDHRQFSQALVPGAIVRIMRNSGLVGTELNSTRFGNSLIETGHVLNGDKGLRIKPVSRAELGKRFSGLVDPTPPVADQDNGFIPKAVWEGTRGYIEKVAAQINSSYQFEIYDGASVLIRRLIETLLIECYEKLGIQSRILKANDEYKMLADIINDAVDNKGLHLGRESKQVLKDIRVDGNRSAHNRRYNATKADLDKSQGGVRVTVEDLLHIAGLK